MSEKDSGPGVIAWVDLTVPDAVTVRDFYSQVTGWRSDAVDMGGYSDFTMLPKEGAQPVAGVCHARGVNEKLPPVWLIYIVVEDLAASMKRCLELGGKIVAPPRNLGPQASYCVIEDPAGAKAALCQTTAPHI